VPKEDFAGTNCALFHWNRLLQKKLVEGELEAHKAPTNPHGLIGREDRVQEVLLRWRKATRESDIKWGPKCHA
jgi:hypothetical protein